MNDADDNDNDNDDDRQDKLGKSGQMLRDLTRTSCQVIIVTRILMAFKKDVDGDDNDSDENFDAIRKDDDDYNCDEIGDDYDSSKHCDCTDYDHNVRVRTDIKNFDDINQNDDKDDDVIYLWLQQQLQLQSPEASHTALLSIFWFI